MAQPTETRERSRRDIRWSRRQRETLNLLAKGHTNAQVAHELGISLDGAKYHVSEIITKLDVDTREEAAEWWRQQKGMRARLRVLTRTGWVPALTPAFLRWGGAGAAAIVGAGVIGIAAFVMMNNPGDAGDSDQGSPDQTPTQAAGTPEQSTRESTPIPDGGGNSLFELEPAPGLVQPYDGDQANASETPGVYFVDLESGDVQGWQFERDEVGQVGISDDNRFTWGSNFIADRRTGDTYQWESNFAPADASGDTVLFTASNDAGVVQGVAVRFAPEPEVAHRFERAPLTAYRWILSSDAERVAGMTDSGLIIIDLTTGERVSVDEGASEDMEVAEFRETNDGERVLIQDGRSPRWWQYHWNGELDRVGGTATDKGHSRGAFSPNGDLFAQTLSRTPASVNDWSAIDEVLPAVRVRNTARDVPLFRITGAALCHANPWLSDSGNLIVALPGNTWGVANASGDMRKIAADAAFPYAAHTSQHVLAFTRHQDTTVPTIFKGDGSVLRELEFPIPGMVPAVPPWAPASDELRVQMPSEGGTDNRCSFSSLVMPRVEFPPSEAPRTLDLHGHARGLALFDAPPATETEGQVWDGNPELVTGGGRHLVGRLGAAPEVTVHETRPGLEIGWSGGQPPDWARVTTSDGQEGWLPITAPPDVPRVETGGSCLNLRKEPAADATSIHCYEDGVPVFYAGNYLTNPSPLYGQDLDGHPGWMAVSTPDGQFGWVAEEFVEQPGGE